MTSKWKELFRKLWLTSDMRVANIFSTQQYPIRESYGFNSGT